MICPNCQTANPEAARFCINCGYGLAPAARCPNCGTPVVPGAKFCFNCGQPRWLYPQVLPYKTGCNSSSQGSY